MRADKGMGGILLLTGTEEVELEEVGWGMEEWEETRLEGRGSEGRGRGRGAFLADIGAAPVVEEGVGKLAEGEGCAMGMRLEVWGAGGSIGAALAETGAGG